MIAPLMEIRRRKLYEDVAAAIEEMIRSGEYAPGDALPSERKIMEQFGVGRPAVREALFALRKMGLVTAGGGGPARVCKPTPEILIRELSGAARSLLSEPEGIHNFQDARVLFEVALVRRAAASAGDGDIEQLAEAIEANQQALGDPPKFLRTDVAFHYVIAVMAGNPIFTALHDGMSAWLAEQREISSRSPGSNQAAAKAHQAIFEAVAARDPDAAETAMRDHLQEVARRYWEVVETTGQAQS